jgi:hypothetical protein
MTIDEAEARIKALEDKLRNLQILVNPYQKELAELKKLVQQSNTVGGREVIFSDSFIIPSGEEASFGVPKAEIKVVLRFGDNSPIPPGPNRQQPGTSWTFADGVLTITFKGFRNQLGTALIKPGKLGNLADGRPFGFSMVHFLFGGVNFVTIQLYAGEGEYL